MSQTMNPDDILIRTMPTPNPYALKFVANAAFKQEGKATFHTSIEAEGLPLVRDIFSIPGVKQVYLFQNTITVTHSGEIEGEELAENVSAIIRTRLPVHDAAYAGPDEKAQTVRREARQHDNPLLQQIEEILDRTIRPGLQADGGDIEVISLENNELRITYQGACGGCPSSMMGTLDAIQGILRHELNLADLLVVPV